MDSFWSGLGTLAIWTLQGVLVFVVSTLLFDTLHWLLHRWGRSKNRLLRRFSRWHWVHHRFLDRKMRVNPALVWPNLIYHVLPEYLTGMAGTLVFLLVFPWPPVAVVALVRTWMLVQTIREEGMDFNHMSMDRISGQQGLWWVNPSYHAMHHVHPNNFFSSFTNGFDLLFGTGTQISGRRFLVTGASGAFGGAMKARLEALGGIVETAKHGVDFAAGDYERMREKLQRADVLVLSHGAKTTGAWDANHRTFVDLIDIYVAMGRSRLTPPEVWALGSEAEFHGDMGMEELRDYAASKRAFARHALGYYRSGDVLYRHIVPSSFTSAMGPGPMSADTAARIALFFIRRGFHYVPVTLTTLAFWNYFRFIRQTPAPLAVPVDSA
jgi:monoglucosyldiacylglycerol epimerase